MKRPGTLKEWLDPLVSKFRTQTASVLSLPSTERMALLIDLYSRDPGMKSRSGDCLSQDSSFFYQTSIRDLNTLVQGWPTRSHICILHTFFFIWRNSPPVDQGLLFHEVSRSHVTTHHSRLDSSGRVISSSQRPLLDNTQHLLHVPGGIRTHNLSRRAAADLRLRPRGQWDRQITCINYKNKNYIMI